MLGKIMLTMSNWQVEVSNKVPVYIGFEGENNVSQLYIVTEIENDMTYTLETKYSNGREIIRNIIPLTIGAPSNLSVNLTSEMIGTFGIHDFQIVGLATDGSKKKSNVFKANVKKSVNGAEVISEHIPYLIDQYIQDFNERMETIDDDLAIMNGYMETTEGYMEQAEQSKADANTHAINALISEQNAKQSENNAKVSENNAKTSEDNVSDAEDRIITLEQEMIEYVDSHQFNISVDAHAEKLIISNVRS